MMLNSLVIYATVVTFLTEPSSFFATYLLGNRRHMSTLEPWPEVFRLSVGEEAR